MFSTTRYLEIYDAEISKLSEKFIINSAVYKLEKKHCYHCRTKNTR